MSLRRARRTLAGLAVAALLAWGTNGLVPDARAASSSPCQPLPAPASSSASASPASSASASPGASASPDQAAVTLCVTVQRAQASVRAGQAAGFTVQVQAQNGAAPDVSVTLTASAGQAFFTGRCPSGDGTATCQLGSLATPTTPASYTLNAQIQTPSAGAVTLTASAAAATTPPMTTAATAATATVVPASTTTSARPPVPSRSSAAATTPPAIVPTVPPALGPVPSPVAESSTVLAPAGNASSLFPVIAPSTSPSQQAAISPAPGTQSALGLARQADSTSGSGTRLAATSAAILGVVALAIAGLLLAPRVSRRLRRQRPARAIADGTAAVPDGSPGSGEPESQVSHALAAVTQAHEPTEALPAGGQPHPGEYLG